MQHIIMFVQIKKMKKRKAFSLFELLVSISIIAILTAVASMSYGEAQKKARDSRRVEDMNNIQKAAEMYYSQNNYSYPSQAQLTSSGLLQQWPTDPKATPYVYQLGTTYCACATMDSVKNGNSSNINCAAGVGGTGLYYCVRSQQ